MKQKTQITTGLKGIINIGPTIAKRLNEIGVYTIVDLQKIGASKAYLKIKTKYLEKTIPVCYYLYSFEGALLGIHWDDVPQKRKEELLKAVGK
jgi:DNA transformation protein